MTEPIPTIIEALIEDAEWQREFAREGMAAAPPPDEDEEDVPTDPVDDVELLQP